MKQFCVIALLLACIDCGAATVDTISIQSPSMQRPIKTVVIRPDSYGQGKRFPVVYLLHGAFGSYSNWITKVPHIRQLADQYQCMIVCPDGGYTSWYFDSPIDPAYKYETFAGTELPHYIDANYNTIADRRARAITGLSMGGHGGFFIGFRHADLFATIGSMSGALNSEWIKQGYGVEKRLGDTIANRQYWHDWSALTVVEHYPKDSVAITFDCGTEDMVIGMNRAMHAKLLQMKIPHEYTERPGKHDWNYWQNSIDYQMVFIRKQFDKLIK